MAGNHGYVQSYRQYAD